MAEAEEQNLSDSVKAGLLKTHLEEFAERSSARGALLSRTIDDSCSMIGFAFPRHHQLKFASANMTFRGSEVEDYLEYVAVDPTEKDDDQESRNKNAELLVAARLEGVRCQMHLAQVASSVKPQLLTMTLSELHEIFGSVHCLLSEVHTAMKARLE